jgi:hypothetical protein
MALASIADSPALRLARLTCTCMCQAWDATSVPYHTITSQPCRSLTNILMMQDAYLALDNVGRAEGHRGKDARETAREEW